MKGFIEWLKAKEIKIPINSRKVVIEFNDKESFNGVVEYYECEAIERMLTVRMSTQEFGSLIQAYMSDIADWR